MLQSALSSEFTPPLPAYLRRKQKDRLFFGVRLDSYPALRVSQFGQRFCVENHVRGTPRPRPLLHISLHHLGDHARLPARIIFAAKRAAESVSVPAFEVTLNAVTAFPVGASPDRQSARHALVCLAQSAGLVELHHGLGGAMQRIGLRARDHFRPHVTFLYGPDAVAQQPIEPIRFTVKDFALIHSEVGLSKYNVIERWPLNGLAH
ncbi:MAG: 2'-5' RNA ligase family protein [Parvibaculaceae bacterium]